MSSALKSRESSDNWISKIEERFKDITEEPTQFLLTAPPEKRSAISALLQDTYQACLESSQHTREMLPELVVEEMDEEQIWQQLELRNNFILPKFIESTSKLVSIKEEKLEVRLREEEEDEQKEFNGDENQDLEMDDEATGESEEDENEEDKEEDFHNDKAKHGKKRLRSSIVDDKFFKLGEMEEFLEAEDAKEMRKKQKKLNEDDTDDIDYFADNLGDDDESDDDGNLRYKDFFDMDDNEMQEDIDKADEVGKKKQKNYFEVEENHEENVNSKEDESDEEEDEDEGKDTNGVEEEDEADDDEEENNVAHKNDNVKDKFRRDLEQPTSSDSDTDTGEGSDLSEKPKSSFELRQERLQQRIKEYEEEVLGEKPWQLKGEIQATSRPQNSLLEEILEFESTVRPAPIITEETTRRLEDIIRQRIKDQAWDDVEAKVRPVRTPQDYRKQLVLDQEKSKESLAQIYEKEYQRELDKLNPNRDDNAAEEEPKEHKEIKRLMRELFVKLDALSNFHFTPKPVAPEPKIITNTPAVAMEEVAPVAMSDAKLLAPEEVYRGPKHDLLGKTERNRTDKNRERRKKKQKQRAIHNALEIKEKKKRQLGVEPTKKEQNTKLLKSLVKHRNVEKINANSEDQRALKSSKSFFSKLQDTTSTATVGTKKATKQKSAATTLSAKKLKL